MWCIKSFKKILWNEAKTNYNLASMSLKYENVSGFSVLINIGQCNENDSNQLVLHFF